MSENIRIDDPTHTCRCAVYSCLDAAPPDGHEHCVLSVDVVFSLGGREQTAEVWFRRDGDVARDPYDDPEGWVYLVGDVMACLDLDGGAIALDAAAWLKLTEKVLEDLPAMLATTFGADARSGAPATR